VKQAITEFRGIAPLFGDNLSAGYAKIAENLDLSTGKIRPLAKHLRITLLGAGAQDFIRWQGVWYFGTGKWFSTWIYNGINILFSLTGTTAKRRIGAIETDLGQDLPPQPTVALYTAEDGAIGAEVDSGTTTAAAAYELEEAGQDFLTTVTVGMIVKNTTDSTYSTVTVVETDTQLTLADDIMAVGETYIIYENPGVLTGTYQYFVVHKRVVGGYQDLSGPSALSVEVTPSAQEVRITRGAISDPYVTHWWIYCMSSNTGEWLFVAEVDAGTTIYDHNFADDQLGEGPTTFYKSNQSNTILLQKPPDFEGICPKIYRGMLLGWNKDLLSTSESVMPDGWDLDVFNQRLPYEIYAVLPIGDELVALTKAGPYRVFGTEPELLAQDRGKNMKPAMGKRARVETDSGLFYLCDEGIALFDGLGVSMFSDAEFAKEWFQANVAGAQAHMARSDDRLYLFHPGGVLVCDSRAGKRNWITLSDVFSGSWVDEETGELFVSMTDGIYKPFSLPYFMPSDLLTWKWRSGDLPFFAEAPSVDRRKEFGKVRVIGSGDVTVNLYVDGAAVGSKVLDWIGDSGKELKYPARTRGRATQVELAGTGTVDELTIEAALA